ncbi:hypothetical protein M422DRAFT_255385 [Sphaerobolus stellatus SS14]|uniref:Fungal lipase-type domain-containing protein n=1 Tax=Sphaerobolus stellatus (strain SS14) TaxID=990650 RepID=A0A0C9VSQ7_SPHS4|nr:hypothetical protein M422DRAFT_255385 [Sphaerobolus stellatus SS14]
MSFKLFFAVLPWLSLALAFPLETRSDPAASQTVFNDLVFYFQYASSAYAPLCPSPNGNTLVTQFSNIATDTQGFIARDDNRKEIVVALRGTSSVQDAFTDIGILLTGLASPGVSPPSGTSVHSGFLLAYNSVADLIISTVKSQLQAHPGYNLVTSGHSLGGALSSLAAVSLKNNFPSSQVTMYTYGKFPTLESQPRTGNPTYAFWVNQLFGNKAFRGVHAADGVPTIIPELVGYRHHGTEYWSLPLESISAGNTRVCAADGEDPTCSDSIPSAGIDLDHTVYYNILAITPFC